MQGMAGDAFAAAGDHDIGVIEEISPADLQAHLEVGAVSFARAAAQMPVDSGEQVAFDQLMLLAGAGYGVDDAINVLVAVLALRLKLQILIDRKPTMFRG